jgi:hypothetical protein
VTLDEGPDPPLHLPNFGHPQKTDLLVPGAALSVAPSELLENEVTRPVPLLAA